VVSDLTVTDLANMRADALNMLPDTCTIQARTSTVNAIGEAADTFTDTYTGVACRLDPVKETEELIVDRPLASGDLILTVAYDQAIDATMRVVSGGVTYEIIGVDAGKSWAVTRRALLRRAA
jgi:SPP1 family predicted phage head-tail adaptor